MEGHDIEEDFSESTLNTLNTGALDSLGMFSERWEQTLRKSVQAIVSVRVNLVRSFDTERATSSQATGFVVDAQRGLILTNRHVISPGPITAEAVFHDHEEVPVWPIYRDPVHDFGFFRFDVTKIKYQKVIAIPLAPELARVGVEIRVVGNDAGEKLSILAGTLARLDRRAPVYGVGKYNDFNTFYFQAASSTSGGSSGSPVLDVLGNAIAMNAGGKKKAASSYYIPLYRVARALTLIQKGEPVTRGTLQTIFKHEAYDEVRRLGVRVETEAHVRHTKPGNTGMLVVEQVLPKGPADPHLNPGDILVSINGETVIDFVHLDHILDDNVGNTLSVAIERGQEQHTFRLTVQDLHAITPARFISISGGILHELSYQVARSYSVPVGGTFVASPGYMLYMAGIQRSAIITSVDNKPTASIDDFVSVVKALPDRGRVPFRFYNLTDVHREHVAVVEIDRHWSGFKEYVRNDTSGLWIPTSMPPPPAHSVPTPGSTTFVTLDDSLGPANKLVASLVTVEFHVPYSIDGVHGNKFVGTGVVLDTARGLLVVDSNTVPISLGDLSVIISASLHIPAKIVFQHPIYNYVIIQYDPALIGETPVKAVAIAEKKLSQGDPVYLIGLSKDQRIVSKHTVVTDVHELLLRECNPPRFRPVNCESIEVDNPVPCQGGVLTNAEGAVQGLWVSYSYQDAQGEDNQFNTGLPVDVLLPVLTPLKQGKHPQLKSMEVEVWPQQINFVRSLGLSNEWVSQIEKANPSRRSVFSVRRLMAGTPASSILKEGDVILRAEDRIVTTLHDLAIEVHQDSVKLDIFRDGKEMTVHVKTVPLSGIGSDRVVGWGGVVLQHPHRAAFQQRREVPGLVYSSWWSNGSPAHMYGLRATIWIIEVNGIPITDLDRFLDVINNLQPSNDYLRIKTIDFSNRVKVLTLKPDDHYWPLWELRRDESIPSGWRLVEQPETAPDGTKRPPKPGMEVNSVL